MSEEAGASIRADARSFGRFLEETSSARSAKLACTNRSVTPSFGRFGTDSAFVVGDLIYLGDVSCRMIWRECNAQRGGMFVWSPGLLQTMAACARFAKERVLVAFAQRS